MLEGVLVFKICFLSQAPTPPPPLLEELPMYMNSWKRKMHLELQGRLPGQINVYPPSNYSKYGKCGLKKKTIQETGPEVEMRSETMKQLQSRTKPQREVI